MIINPRRERQRETQERGKERYGNIQRERVKKKKKNQRKKIKRGLPKQKEPPI